MFLEDARSLLETGGVCDHCLGRCFADRGEDLTNEARGRALRTCVAMMEDNPVKLVEPEDCWVCEGLVPDYDSWASRATDALESLEFETFLVGTRVPDSIEEHETDLRERVGMETDAGFTLNAECNRQVGKRLESSLGATVDFDYPDVVTILDIDSEEVDLQINPAYLYGRYRKLEPGLAQQVRICRVCNGSGTQWRDGSSRPCESCDGSGYDTEESVELFVTETIRQAMDGSDTVFNAAGRENDDVLVLGEGRPFVVEVKEPSIRPPDLDEIQEKIAEVSDGIVEIQRLTTAKRDVVARLTQLSIRQLYRLELTFLEPVARSTFEDAISELDSASVRQRIEHDERVTEQVRVTGGVTGEFVSDTEATVDIESKDGLNLEALMRGGTDRSDPNLADLLDTEVSIDSIAVITVEGVEESFVKPEHLRRENPS